MKRLFTALVLCWAMSCGGANAADYREEIPFVPTPIEVIDRMLELAEVKNGDVLYDLGSGDGRIVIRAAQKYGIHAVGIEMDQLLLDKARAGMQNPPELRYSRLCIARDNGARETSSSK
ncbi:MAG: hypothetical protein E6J73_08535 [Deltaproteobacteria bacterium]|nr:MAG: hypothetical protein E6J73_08535 [Deltaproteobacteria bacterium]